MKKILFLLLIPFYCFGQTGYSPVGTKQWNKDTVLNTKALKVNSQGGAIIGGYNQNADAVLEVSSTTKGFLPPRMTTAQRNAISVISNGLEVYDTDLNLPCVYNGSWVCGSGVGTVTSASVVSANGLAGTVATATSTPAITLSTTVTGILKGNGTAISAATNGTDYLSSTTGWKTLGNSGTNPSTNFIGTTDVPTFKLRAGANVAGQIDSLATGNNGFGFGVFSAMTTGVDNTALGYSALSSNTEGEQNNAVGSNSLSSNTTGNYNQAFGSNALMSNVSGSGNIGIGNAALFECLGDDNVAVGHSAVRNATTGDQNVGIGEDVLGTLETGLRNTAIGYTADIVNQNDVYATALGAFARASSYQVAFGDSTHEIYVGREMASTSGAGNVLTDLTGNGRFTSAPASIVGAWRIDGNIGIDTSINFLGTTDNTPLKFKVNSLFSGYISPENTFFGYNALFNEGNTGSDNTGIGVDALRVLTTGVGNTAIGSASGFGNTEGEYNTFIGLGTGGTITTGDNNTMLGYDAETDDAGALNRIALGYGAIATENFQFAIPDNVTSLKFAGITDFLLGAIPAFDDDTDAGALATGTIYQTTGLGAAPLNVAGILMIKQ